ncbi:MAG: FMN-binding protein [Candidatus Thiodiazotropha sp. (ex Lucina aurantia)]|nr:FMN-binding protein [Candidatus Thiodiazotropha sp. (ex Lucina pensylvanica)]MBT3024396.1 FMN-binding protein [Candidatus Thiodiazotropha taylori]MBT3051855.1 FMN-binding protein [Candidatus Thiodiazotropha sp. (ex Codakia orbicularis)]MBV2104060.1 FMN-binding protein [Candidatus Thiodiazotropha sp. (ex Lucina aurantia)]MBT3032394.1 FMN-binding protein [Candidatus Thiodiazotropha sp. (ex Lucina pensylvanica)]
MSLKRLLLHLAFCGFVAIAATTPSAWAQGTYLTKEEFLSQSLGESYASHKLWFSKAVKQKLKQIFGHKYPGLRIRYWSNSLNSRQTAWILNEIGKVKPITIGVVINDRQIESISVLAFRESRGWEIKQTFFTDQFLGAALNSRLRLSQHIDSISGATLSVIAMKKVARAALFLSQQVEQTKSTVTRPSNGDTSG